MPGKYLVTTYRYCNIGNGFVICGEALDRFSSLLSIYLVQTGSLVEAPLLAVDSQLRVQQVFTRQKRTVLAMTGVHSNVSAGKLSNGPFALDARRPTLAATPRYAAAQVSLADAKLPLVFMTLVDQSLCVSMAKT